MKKWVQLFGAALLTGTLTLFALPLGEQWYLGYFALVPLLIATKERGFIGGFLGGIIAIFWLAFLSTTGALYKVNFLEDCPVGITLAVDYLDLASPSSLRSGQIKKITNFQSGGLPVLRLRLSPFCCFKFQLIWR
jgi:hypothetical protein